MPEKSSSDGSGKDIKGPSITSLLNKHKTNALAILVYSVLTIIFTYPVAFLKDSIPGVSGDAYFFLWDFWWFKESLFNLQNPYYTNYLFHPTGLNLAYSALTQFNAILSIPLQMVFGLTEAYNILWLISFIIAGYGTFLLVKYLVGDVWAAFISGIIFMFCPYHFVHGLGHMNLTALEWIPFYVLFLIKSVKESNKINYVYASVFLFLSTLCDYNYGFYLVSFTILYFAYLSIMRIKSYRKIGAILILYLILILPFVTPLLIEVITSKSQYMYSGGSVNYSADLFNFLLPSTLNIYLGNIFGQVNNGHSGIEGTVFAGYLVLTLSLVAVFKVRINDTKFWAISALIFAILSLGPLLHVNGTLTNILLPYAIIENLPILASSRAPGRWDVLVMLSLSVLAGYGTNYIFNTCSKWFSHLPVKKVLFVIFTAIIIFEFYDVPYITTSTTVPEFYNQLAKDDQNYAIYEIPDWGTHLTFPEYMYYQTVHRKELISGYTHIPDYAKMFTENTPLIRELYLITWARTTPFFDDDILIQNITDMGSSVLSYYNINYVIVHEDYMSKDQSEYANAILKSAVDPKPVFYKDGNMTVYKVNNESPTREFILLGDGWSPEERIDNIPTRQAQNNTTLLIYSADGSPRNLSFDIMSNESGMLRVYLNDEVAYEQPIFGNFTHVDTVLYLINSTNTVKFDLVAYLKKTIPDQESKDTQSITFAFRNFTISNAV